MSAVDVAEAADLRASADARRNVLREGRSRRGPIDGLARALGALETPGSRVRHISSRYGLAERHGIDVYAPPSRRPLPLVAFFYGAAWRGGARQWFRFVGRALATLGCVAIVPDHRHYPEARFPAFVDDGAAAVRWAHRNARRFGGDPDRIALVGHSAGAHTAMMLGLDRRYLAAVGVPHAVVRAVVGLSGPYDFHPFPLPLCEDAFGSARRPEQTQPVRLVRADAPPTLLIAGERDRFVPVENTLSLARALTRVGAQCEVHIHPRAGHAAPLLGLMRAAAPLLPVRRTVSAFLREAFSGEAAPRRTACADRGRLP